MKKAWRLPFVTVPQWTAMLGFGGMLPRGTWSPTDGTSFWRICSLWDMGPAGRCRTLEVDLQVYSWTLFQSFAFPPTKVWGASTICFHLHGVILLHLFCSDRLSPLSREPESLLFLLCILLHQQRKQLIQMPRLWLASLIPCCCTNANLPCSPLVLGVW